MKDRLATYKTVLSAQVTIPRKCVKFIAGIERTTKVITTNMGDTF